MRAAIQEANNTLQNPGADAIRFNVPSTDCNANTGVCTISPASALPTITEAVTIDGYAQRPCSSRPAPCSKENSSAVGTNANLLIQLNGANSGFAPGLLIRASNSVVKGLAVNRFDGTGIVVQDTSSVNPTGNRIEGNFIGANAAGTAGLGNLFHGVAISGTNDVVGGTLRAARNLISGNGQSGIVSFGSGTQVLGNLVGTDDTGTQDLGNGWGGGGWSGIYIDVDDNTVGGDTAASANVIAFNAADGVSVFEFVSDDSFNTGNAILGNSIFANGNLGIDLNTDGRTTNDADSPSTVEPDPDSDTGANNLQNFPVVSSAETAGTSATVKGSLNSTPSTTFVVRFYSNPSNDNEGRRYLGQLSVDTDEFGDTGTFTFSPEQRILVGQKITATATTEPGGDTSEFRGPREVTGRR